MRFLVVLVFVSWLAPSETSNAQHVRPGTTLAWFEVSQGVYETRFFRGERVVRRRPGVFIAVGGDVVEIKTQLHTVPRYRCVDMDLMHTPGETVTGTELLAEWSDGSTMTLIGVDELDGNDHAFDEITLHGSIGPYLAVEHKRDWMSTCSAHPNPYRGFFWFDLRTGLPVSNVTPPADVAMLTPAADRWFVWDLNRVRGALRDAGRTGASLAGLMPRRHMHSWLSTSHFVIGVSYAQTAGDGGAYERTLALKTHGLPSFVPSTLLTLPQHIVGIAERRQIRLGGVSRAQRVSRRTRRVRRARRRAVSRERLRKLRRLRVESQRFLREGQLNRQRIQEQERAEAASRIRYTTAAELDEFLR